MNRAVFIDRDGTIAKDIPYCSRPEDFELLPTVGEGIRLLNGSGFKVIIITNQSGIARGYFTEQTLQRIHEKMEGDLAGYGAHIDAIYYCPHHPDDHCHCRKPNIGLLEKAAQELRLDLSSSYLIGDKFLDIETANKARCKAVLVPSSEPEKNLLRDDYTGADIDFICSDFYTAVRWIVDREQGGSR